VLDPGIETQLRQNEQIWLRFRQLEIGMLNADSLAEVINVVIGRLPAFFPSVHVVSIAWLDPERELARELEADGSQARVPGAVISLPALPDDLLPSRPQLGVPAPGQQALFPRDELPPRSVAIVPLPLRGRMVGSLNQGSLDAGHFTPEAATDLLEHLAAVTALCIDSAMNRARLRRDGLTDALTGVANRRFFERRLEEEINLWQRHGGALSCLLIDLDRFKQINDRHGHAAGDRALQQVARQLNHGLRASDVLARYGGEEFVLLLPATDSRQSHEIAERLRAAVAGDDAIAGAGSPVTVSIGLASLEEGMFRNVTESPGAWLLRQADEALYRAKAQGRNRVAMMPAGVTAETPT
jgi:diguanylate cyclase (GGDEF)-like protein